MGHATQKGWKNPLARQYQITRIPQALIIDREGKIAASELRDTCEVERALWELLCEQNGASATSSR
jgi:hypothetical protein